MEIPNSVWIGLIGVMLVIIQFVVLYTNQAMRREIDLLRKEISSLWTMVDTHGHTVECATNDCKLKTDKVIINQSA